MSALKMIGRMLYAPYRWLVLLPFIVIDTLFLGFFASFLSLFAGPRITGFFGVFWSRLNAFVTPMFVRVRGRENIDSRQSYVIVSNHQSWYDIFVIYGWLGIDFKWVMKHTLRKVPGLGLYCEKMGHIFIDRSNTASALESIGEARGRITGGVSVMFFPEGTIFGRGRLGEFKKGAYHFALDMGLPILPVTISGTENILPYKSWKIFPGVVTLTFHKPIPVQGRGESAMDDLIEESKKAIASALSLEQSFDSVGH